MIGDWVMQDDNLQQNRTCQITGIYDNVVVDVTGEKVPLHESHIKPIPLTPEILMKSGFREDRPGITYRLRRYGETKIDIVDVFFHQDRAVTASINGTTSDIFVNVLHCHCEHVHELQHALRMCGIEKDIEL